MAAAAAAESASPIGIANLPNQRHKIVAKRGAGFTIMVRAFGNTVKGQELLANTVVVGRWRVGIGKDNLHQHPFLHHHQELCRP